MKLTGWYGGDQKPVRVGLYQRWYPTLRLQRWAFWDGAVWSYGNECKRDAIALRGMRSPLQCLPWRGIKGPKP